MTTSPVVSITDELIAELEAAANAATPGPWDHIRINDISWVASEDWEILDLRCDKPLDAEDGEFIAQANPATILALLAERADLKQQLAAASVDAQMLADARSVISREWLPRSVGSSAAKDLLIQKLDARLSGAARDIASSE